MKRLSILLSLFCLLFVNDQLIAQDEDGIFKSQLTGITVKFPGAHESLVSDKEGGKIEEAGYRKGQTEFYLKISKSEDDRELNEQLEKFGSAYKMSRKLSANFHMKNEGKTEGAERKEWNFAEVKGEIITFRNIRYRYAYASIIIDSALIELTVKERINKEDKSGRVEIEGASVFFSSLTN